MDYKKSDKLLSDMYKALEDRRARILQEIRAAIPDKFSDQDFQSLILQADQNHIDLRKQLPLLQGLCEKSSDMQAIKLAFNLTYFQSGLAKSKERLDNYIKTSKNYRHDTMYASPLARERMAFKIKKTCGKTRESVARFLQASGYSIIDYVGGYAVDATGKNKYKIGKLIQSNVKLNAAFQRDISRRQNRLRIIISSDIKDILTMSTARPWKTCYNLAEGEEYYRPLQETKAGSMVAYLVRDNDPEAHFPIARAILKLYRNKNGNIIFKESNFCGLADNSFRKNLYNICHDINAYIFTKQNLSVKDMYNFDRPYVAQDFTTSRLYLPINMPTDKFLEFMQVPFYQSANGKYIVEGDLDLSRWDLHELPDLKSVIVKGRFDISNNAMYNLKNNVFLCNEFNAAHNFIPDEQIKRTRTIMKKRQLAYRNSALDS